VKPRFDVSCNLSVRLQKSRVLCGGSTGNIHKPLCRLAPLRTDLLCLQVQWNRTSRPRPLIHFKCDKIIDTRLVPLSANYAQTLLLSRIRQELCPGLVCVSAIVDLYPNDMLCHRLHACVFLCYST
jgi:hypothetical protein